MSTWKRVVPEQSRKGDLIEHGSLECQEKIQYRWVNLNPKIDWVCVDTTKYYKQKKQVSNDYGQTWGDVIPYQYQRGAAYEIHSTDCGYTPEAIYRWTNMDISTDWICEYVPETYKIHATYSGGQTYEKECDGNAVLTDVDTKSSPYDYKEMTSVIIGNCISSLGVSGFSGSWPFYDFTNLSRVNSEIEGECNIPVGVETIGTYAFDSCTKLVKVNLPYSVKFIGVSAFDGCSSLIKVNSEIEGECNIPNGVTDIEGHAFANCSGLTDVIIPSSANVIGLNPYAADANIKSITVDANNAYYDSRNNCNAIIKTSTNELISGCKNTIIPNNVTSIGRNAFLGATGLTNITIPNSVTSIGEQAFQSCESLASINIPTGVTSIDDYVFSYCYSLTSVTIPNTVTEIGRNAFESCRSLTGITIPNSVTSIGQYAFGGCISLTGITIPDSVTSIGSHAFYYCYSLTSVTCLATTPPTLGGNLFGTSEDPQAYSVQAIYVPSSSVNAYKTAEYWSTYANLIQPIQ